MKKILYMVIFLMYSTSFASDFSPTIMKITAPNVVNYSFDGSSVTIPFSLSGTPAAVWLVINTKDQSQNIKNVRNGNLGWHYVNKIDTTVFISGRFEKTPGENKIVWDGKDENGKIVKPGIYNYYLWGFDDKTPRIQLSKAVEIGYEWDSPFVHVIEKAADGTPLAHPMLFGSNVWWRSAGSPFVRETSPFTHGTTFKWIVGNDPEDLNLLQTTNMAIYNNPGFSYGAPVLNPKDYNMFYNCSVDFMQKKDTFNKWTFVSGGDAVLDPNWLGWGKLSIDDNGAVNDMWAQKPSCFTDGNYIYAVSSGFHNMKEEWNKLRCVSFDGKLVFDKMMHEWYMPDDHGAQGFINGGFHNMYTRNPNEFFLISHASCMHELIDTSRLVIDPANETDMIKFRNGNGDFFMDSAYSPTAEPKWFCLTDDMNVSMRRDSVAIDKNGFNVIGVSYLGLSSFGVSTQDGTGIGYMSFADDTVSDNHALKGGGLLCHSGSAYDGLYYGGALKPETVDWTENDICSTYFIAFDSFKGVIAPKK